MDRLDHHCLISVFKHLDLPSRLQASKTCKLWRALLQDSEVLMNDIGEVYLTKWNPDQGHSEIPSVLAVLSHLKSCHQLKLGPGTAPGFLSEELLKDELARFDNVVIIPEGYNWGDSLGPFLSLLPSTVTRLETEDVSLSQGFILNLAESVQLKALNLTFLDVESGANPLVLPSTLTTYGYNYYREVKPGTPYLTLAAQATDHFLNSFPVGPLLTDLTIGGLLYLNDRTISDLLRTIRDGSPNLRRISFQNMGFFFVDIDAISKEYFVRKGKNVRLLPIQRIEFGRCFMHWHAALDLLIRISDVKMIIINLRVPSTSADLAALYALMPAIKGKGARLELTINGLQNLENILVPFELSGVLSKLELIDIHHSHLFRIMFCGDDSFELLTEIRLEGCIGLGDAELEIVAKRCKSLKKLKFKPHHCLSEVTDRWLQPFMVHWDDRKSTQLVIECLKPARPFNGFSLPSGQEKGVFDDGKKWMLYRKACLLDGCDQMGTRLVIWDDQIDGGGKSMVITDYKRKFEKHLDQRGVWKMLRETEERLGYQVDCN